MRLAGPAALWLALLAVYAATLGVPATGTARYAGPEARYLAMARSVSTHDGVKGLGVAALLAGPSALGGSDAVALAVAAVVALGFALAVALARRLVPDPWATGGVVLAALSPPALAAATTVGPEPLAGTALAGAVLCALRVREHARLRFAYGGAVLLGLLPWLNPWLALVGLPVAVCLVRWTAAERRRLVALISAELMLGSVVFYARLAETLDSGPQAPSAPDVPLGYAGRIAHLPALLLDRGAGLLRWAPVLALAGFGAWLLWRSRRERVAAVIPERREAERGAELLVWVAAAAWLVATFASARLVGPWPPGLPLATGLPCMAALAAWGLRHAPRTGLVLGALTLAASAWLLVAGGAWWPPRARAPWGPLVRAFPAFTGQALWPSLCTALALAILAALAMREWRARPRPAAPRR